MIDGHTLSELASIVGDPANTAARIEGLNKHLHTQLLASASTLEGVEGILCRFLGDFRFVGKTETLPILEVLALKESASELQLSLCKRFDSAIAEMRKGRWHEAAKLFEDVLQDFPDDGPSRFHLERCLKYSVSPPEHPPCTVHMDAK